jgi:hypothetical protein
LAGTVDSKNQDAFVKEMQSADQPLVTLGLA